MIRAVIVEDEPLAARALRAMLEGTGGVEVVATARDRLTGFRACAEGDVDAAFLDIRLVGGDGLALAADLTRLPVCPLLVFTTGDSARAVEAFRVRAVDYLLKPLDPSQVQEAVHRLTARMAAREPAIQSTSVLGGSQLGLREDRLPVKCGREDVIRLLPRHEIVAAVHHDRRTWIHTTQDEFPTYYPLTDLLTWMGEPGFLAISRSAIVNLQAVDEVVHYGDRLYQVRLRDRQRTCVDASRSGCARLAALVRPSLVRGK